MRLLKVILTGLFAVFAVLAGLFVALVGVLTFVVRLVRNRPSSAAARVEGGARRDIRPRTPPARTPNTDDVIEVTATEVPADPVTR